VNTFFAAMAFFVVRDLGLFVAIYFIGLPWLITVYIRSKHSFLNILLLIEFAVVVNFFLVLNVYWSVLIYKQLNRIFTRGQ